MKTTIKFTALVLLILITTLIIGCSSDTTKTSNAASTAVQEVDDKDKTTSDDGLILSEKDFADPSDSGTTNPLSSEEQTRTTSNPKEGVENNKPAHSELNDSDHDKADDTGTLGTKNKTDSSYSEDNSQNMGKNDEKEISSEHQKNSGQQLENWRELYNLPYSLSCMDERLGVSTTREFQTGLRSPTTQEMTSLETCDLAYSSSNSNQSVSSKNAPVDKRPNQEEADDMNVLDRIEFNKVCKSNRLLTSKNL